MYKAVFANLGKSILKLFSQNVLTNANICQHEQAYALMSFKDNISSIYTFVLPWQHHKNRTVLGFKAQANSRKAWLCADMDEASVFAHKAELVGSAIEVNGLKDAD